MRDFTQTNNCSNRPFLVCQSRQDSSGRGRWTSRRTGCWVRRGDSGPFSHIKRQACVLCVSQQGHTVRHADGPCPHQQMFFGYCCFSSLVIVFHHGQPVQQGARLCCGKELWRDETTHCLIRLSTQAVNFFFCSMWVELQNSKCNMGSEIFIFSTFNIAVLLRALL